jgi:hypothetical protein
MIGIHFLLRRCIRKVMVSIREIVNIVNLETLALFPNRALIKFKQDLTFDQPRIDQVIFAKVKKSRSVNNFVSLSGLRESWRSPKTFRTTHFHFVKGHFPVPNTQRNSRCKSANPTPKTPTMKAKISNLLPAS